MWLGHLHSLQRMADGKMCYSGSYKYSCPRSINPRPLLVTLGQEAVEWDAVQLLRDAQRARPQAAARATRDDYVYAGAD